MRRVTRWGLRLAGLLPAPLAFLALRLFAHRPQWIEDMFSRRVYPPLMGALSRISAQMPSSVAERALPIAAVLTACLLLFRVGQSLWRHSAKPFGRFCYRLVCGVGACYAVFVLLWGFNFARQPFATSADLPLAPASTAELSALCDDLVDDATRLRAQLPESSDGTFLSPMPLPELLRKVPGAYGALSRQYPWLSGQYAAPKLLKHGETFSEMQVMGIFIPYTAEALLNGGIPATQLAHTACHEAAHQRGFAREAEADYIAYLACMASGDPGFAYSGTLTMLRYASLALNARDPIAYNALAQRVPASVQRDYAEQYDYWSNYETPLAGLVSMTNQRYLSTFALQQPQQQRDEVVSMLLARYRLDHRKNP